MQTFIAVFDRERKFEDGERVQLTHTPLYTNETIDYNDYMAFVH